MWPRIRFTIKAFAMRLWNKTAIKQKLSCIITAPFAAKGKVPVWWDIQVAQQVGPATVTKKDTTVAALTDTMTAQHGKSAHCAKNTGCTCWLSTRCRLRSFWSSLTTRFSQFPNKIFHVSNSTTNHNVHTNRACCVNQSTFSQMQNCREVP